MLLLSTVKQENLLYLNKHMNVMYNTMHLYTIIGSV